MSANRKAAEQFAKQFTPPLDVVKTEQINGHPMPDCWMTVYWDAKRGIGLSAFFYRGSWHATAGILCVPEGTAYVEAKPPTKGASPVYAGKLLAAMVGRKFPAEPKKPAKKAKRTT